jgi:hypothetical protein
MAKYFSPKERERAGAQGFFALWAEKESVLKYYGWPLARLGRLRGWADEDAVCWPFALAGWPDYRGCLCAPRGTPPPALRFCENLCPNFK